MKKIVLCILGAASIAAIAFATQGQSAKASSSEDCPACCDKTCKPC
jgi:hypothetical protein